MTRSPKKTSSRRAPLASLLLALASSLPGCIDRPIAEQTPRTSNALTDQVRTAPVDKIDLLFMIDNSGSMADKQKVLARAVPDLVNRLINPVCVAFGSGATSQPARPEDPCPAGMFREFTPVTDIHIGVITSSLGSHGADSCEGDEKTDRARLIHRDLDRKPVRTYASSAGADLGFFVWDPLGKSDPPGDSVAQNGKDGLIDRFTQVVIGANQEGCGYEASLEAWYRFLVDPTPPLSVRPPAQEGEPAVVEGVDEALLAQRAAFLRPDSLVAIINLSDENDCSVIDGALPATVCDEPELDEAGRPVGCRSAPAGWPAGYAEGNFHDRQADDRGRVTGTPERANHQAVQLDRKDTSDFHLPPGTAVCASDPYALACTSDRDAGPLTDGRDLHSVRCWNQKQRFGVDRLYPTRRYTDGLSQAKVYDRNGFLVDNPLFDDLPYRQAMAEGRPLRRAKIRREPGQVIFANIIGVPWQDIARDPDDLTRGYRPARPVDDAPGIDWRLILGDPRSSDPLARQPADPLMIESVEPRSGTHPITGEAVGLDAKNSINGREHEPTRENNTEELQYTCTFPLPPGDERECEQEDSPLCDSVTGGDGKVTKVQTRAKAFPGSRFLEVARDFGSNAVVASICSPNLVDSKADDYGYRPAVVAIVDRLKAQLSDRCLPRKLATSSDGTAPCLIVDARFPADAAEAAEPDEVAACQRCDRAARRPLDPALRALLPASARQHACLCEITQITGADDLAACRTDPNPQMTLPSDSEAGGWCYVDPATAPAEQKEGAAAFVAKCPTNERRKVRFVNASTEGSTLFMTCLGDASGN